MKYKLCILIGLTIMLGLSSCTEDKIVSNTQLVKSISITGQDFQSGESDTKAAYTVDGTGMHFSWTEGDTVGIYPVGGDQVAFPISSGIGGQTAQFDGGAWALRSSYSYAAYYPYVKGNYMVDETQIPISFIGQTQNGNGSLDCLDRFDYQASVATSPDAEGNVNIEMKHLGSFVRLQFTMPIADTYKSITLTSDKTPFITSGTFDLTKDYIAITPMSISPSITISLSNTATTADDKVLTVFAMLAPTDLSNSEISISIEGTTYKSYSVTISGKNMIVGKAYSYSSIVQSGTNIDGNDVEWDNEGHETIVTPYQYVDLGLSVNWATFNVGATKPEEYGDYFAWGEIEPYYEEGYAQSTSPIWKKGKSQGYDWPSYKYAIGPTLYTKYVIERDPNYNGGMDFVSRIANPIMELELEDDAANANWGGNWRMPTELEMQELMRYCTYSSAKVNDVWGVYYTSTINGNSIFLPHTGGYKWDRISYQGEEGNYWFNSIDVYNSNYPGYLESTPGRPMLAGSKRYFGYAVRPVCPSTTAKITSIELDQDSIVTLKGAFVYLYRMVRPVDGDEVKSYPITWSIDNTDVAGVTMSGILKAKSPGTALITGKCLDKTINIKLKVVNTMATEYVDLGLSVKWATDNIDSKTNEYGSYYASSYAWGETETKDNYDASNYKYYDSSFSLIKYNTSSVCGIVDNKTTLDLEDDVAYIKLGSNWRMPTLQEFEELMDRSNCVWTFVDLSGKNGYLISSKKSGYENNYLFLPCANYWSSSLCIDNPNSAYYLKCGENNYSTDYINRTIGFYIRPVCP